MELDRVDPDIRQATRKLPVPDVSRTLNRIAVRTATRLLPAHRVPGVSSKTERAGEARVRVYRPESVVSDAGLLWIHGGGYVMGSWRQDHRHCAETARELGIVVVSAEYRLAPEHPFPVPLDDVQGAWDWMQREADRLRLAPDRIAVGGESAGGGLAATLAHRLLDAVGEGNRPLAQWLFAPMLDDRTAADRTLDPVDHWIWDNAANRFGWSAYLAQPPDGPAVPAAAVAARREDLSGLPPTWIGVGDIDLFHDEDVEYARRLTAAGVDTTLDVVTGAPHGFENWAMDTAPAQALLARSRAWLADRVRR